MSPKSGNRFSDKLMRQTKCRMIEHDGKAMKMPVSGERWDS
jgi:hypothetical protein